VVSAHVTRSELETETLGESVAHTLRAGDVVFLRGPLGAGKTAFVRGMAKGLGCDLEAVSSPTFTLVQEYSGPIPLQHVDLYRLSSVEADDLALEDLMETSVMAIEWAERWDRRPAGGIEVGIERVSDTERRIVIERP
jgi:tRNA threonylcarbamoyladenosine biosynthesis protein TsaE